MSNLVLKKLYYVDHEVANFFKNHGLLKVLLLLVLLAIMMIISTLLFLSLSKNRRFANHVFDFFIVFEHAVVFESGFLKAAIKHVKSRFEKIVLC